MPDWYKKFKDAQVKGRVNYVDSSSESESSFGQSETKDNISEIGRIIKTEVIKCMGNMMQHMSSNNSVKEVDANMVQNAATTPFEGHYAFTIVPSIASKKWMVDSRASSHICSNVGLLFTTYRLDHEVIIHLPDGSSRAVTHGGKVKLNMDVILTDVLYLPGFTHNLIYVAQ